MARSLYSRAFGDLCLVMLLGFASINLIQPILPLVVFTLGGDAGLVGLMIVAFSAASAVLRPMMGRLVDYRGDRITLQLGTIILALTSVAYVAPSLALIACNRIVHGAAWGAFNTAAASTFAKLAPPNRRGEAAAIFNVPPAIAQMAMPAIGVALVSVSSISTPFILAAAMGLCAFAVARFGRLPRPIRKPPQRSAGAALIDRGALLPMIIEALFSSTSSLFTVYPPVFALVRGIPPTELVPYFAITGAVLVVSRLISGRFIDHVSRGVAILVGTIVGLIGLLLAATADSIAGLTVAGMIYVLAAGFTSPAIMALAIDRAQPGRMGGAMATYTLGVQLGFGAGGAFWGFVIQFIGYPWPYLAAIMVQFVQVGLLVRHRSDLMSRGGPTRG